MRLALPVWLLATATVVLAAGYAPEPVPPRIQQLQQWIAAVHEHEPGTADRSAQLVASWSQAQLESLFPYVRALVQLAGTGRVQGSIRLERNRVFSTATVFSAAEMNHLVNLAEREAGADRNRIMKRGALLHTTVGIMTAADEPAPAADGDAASRSPRVRSPVPRRTSVVGTDGRYRGVTRQGLHWDYARMLLDAVVPRPADDEMVRGWYHAIATYFAAKYMLAEALPHLERARELLPRDAHVLLDSGCLHETLASPQVQAIARTSLSRGIRITAGSLESNLRSAERYFRRALQIQPRLVEARVRLARVLQRRGRQSEARAELERAMPDITVPEHQYYAYLFLAEAARAMGDVTAARQAYQRAAALYPRAQSPRLGLSQLARQQANRAEAVRAIEAVFSLPAAASERDDPWWSYDAAGGRDPRALMEAVSRVAAESAR